MQTVRAFRLKRVVDETGVSGTGVVAVGIKLPTGCFVMEWCADSEKRSLGIYQDEEEMLGIHGHGGKTRIEWLTQPMDFKDMLPVGINVSQLPEPLKL
jgi:hypothetical protein